MIGLCLAKVGFSQNFGFMLSSHTHLLIFESGSGFGYSGNTYLNLSLLQSSIEKKETKEFLKRHVILGCNNNREKIGVLN